MGVSEPGAGGTMTRAIGIDPGTVSFDVCGRDGDRLLLDRTFSTVEAGADPGRLVDVLRSVGPVDIIVGPSGYGLPWVGVEDLGPREIDLMLLGDKREGSLGTIVAGMGGILQALKESGLPLCFAPGVIHLPTVPAHRKANRIDMGTADKLCAVALGIWDQARRLGVPYDEVSFVYMEMGGAFTAVTAVEDGRIVDGSGGTSGAMGYQALGAMDGEVAYLLGGFSKGNLATGGMAWIAGTPDRSPEEIVSVVDADCQAALAWEAFLEGVVKQVAAQMTVLAHPREIMLSGRLSRVPELFQEITRRLAPFAPVRKVEGFASVSAEAAQGAALLGQGLAGDPTLEGLVETMELRGAHGSVLDHLYVGEAEELRRRYAMPESRPAPFCKGS
ncbi:MAG: DUF1464 family protein [Actinobacteria bacterium]|nr:DUF1464 family protein [Actinomycetota bacterium]